MSNILNAGRRMWVPYLKRKLSTSFPFVLRNWLRQCFRYLSPFSCHIAPNFEFFSRFDFNSSTTFFLIASLILKNCCSCMWSPSPHSLFVPWGLAVGDATTNIKYLCSGAKHKIKSRHPLMEKWVIDTLWPPWSDKLLLSTKNWIEISTPFYDVVLIHTTSRHTFWLTV